MALTITYSRHDTIVVGYQCVISYRESNIYHVYLLFLAASNINEGSDERRRLCGATISDSPIMSSTPRSFRNNCSPRMYRSRQFLPLWISWLAKNKPASRSSTDGRVSRLSTDGWVSPMFSKKRDSPSSSNDTPTTSPTRKREDTTLRENIWTIGTTLFKHTTKNYFLVFDKNGNLQSNVTIHRPF